MSASCPTSVISYTCRCYPLVCWTSLAAPRPLSPALEKRGRYCHRSALFLPAPKLYAKTLVLLQQLQTSCCRSLFSCSSNRSLSRDSRFLSSNILLTDQFLLCNAVVRGECY